MACGSCRGPGLETAGRQLCCPVGVRPVGVGSPEGCSLVLVPLLLGLLPSVLPSHGPWCQARDARQSRPPFAALWLPPLSLSLAKGVPGVLLATGQSR